MQARLKLKSDMRAVAGSVQRDIAKLVTGAFRDGAKNLKESGRAAIAAGGFGGKWQNAWIAKGYPKSGASLRPRIFASHKIGYAGEFQEPDSIVGHPLIWLPIEANLPGGTHWTPKKFARLIGPLRGGRRGSPKKLLFGQVAVNRSGRALKRTAFKVAAHKAWLPVFVGVPQVRDPKRFDLYAIADRVADEIVAKIEQG